VSGGEVWAGPADATLIGNLLVSARAVGALPGSVREVVRASFTPEIYRPRTLPGLEAAYQRLLRLP
ncbi:MAG: hypothetical protein K6T35_02920, partial [Meiothermus silvanus]|nr:hypothetical protein [Allomeiothermus silvanus]